MLDIWDPTFAIGEGTYSTAGYCRDVAVAGNLVYAAIDTGGRRYHFAHDLHGCHGLPGTRTHSEPLARIILESPSFRSLPARNRENPMASVAAGS